MVIISQRLLEGRDKGEWVGVDLDGTTLTYDNWVGWNVFGRPIEPMIDRIRAWIAAGIEVRIVTARIGLPFAVQDGKPIYSKELKNKCLVTGKLYSDHMMQIAVQDALEQIACLPRLVVQCYKEVTMMEFYDDRAIQMVPNTGRTLAEEHEAERTAQRGKQFQGAEQVDVKPADPTEFYTSKCNCGPRVLTAGRVVGDLFSGIIACSSFCGDSWEEFMETSIISMATALALSDAPAIEHGTEEARFETERLVTGLEGRLIGRLREMYRTSQELDAAALKDEARGKTTH